jgi:hypothetical protein
MPQQGMTDLSRLRKRPLETDAATSARAPWHTERAFAQGPIGAGLVQRLLASIVNPGR